MAYNINQVSRKKSSFPPIITIYGRPGRGKTTLASQFPDPIFIQTENGAGDLEIATFTPGGAMEWHEEVLTALSQVYSEPHDFKTLVIDSINHAEILVQNYTCRKNGWASIESPGYGKGFTEVAEHFRAMFQWIERIRDHRNMNVVLLAHPQAEDSPDPHLDSYRRFSLKMDKRNGPYVIEKSDVVGLLDIVTTLKEDGGPRRETRAKSSGQRELLISGGVSFEAKTRLHSMPDRILIPPLPANGYDAIAPYLPMQDALGRLDPRHPLYQQSAQPGSNTPLEAA